MDNKRLSYYSNLIGYIFTFMEVVDNGSILNEKALQNLEDAKKMAAEVVELPKEKRTEAITRPARRRHRTYRAAPDCYL